MLGVLIPHVVLPISLNRFLLLHQYLRAIVFDRFATEFLINFGEGIKALLAFVIT